MSKDIRNIIYSQKENISMPLFLHKDGVSGGTHTHPNIGLVRGWGVTTTSKV